MLDECMRTPEAPEKDMVCDIEVAEMRDIRALLVANAIEDAAGRLDATSPMVRACVRLCVYVCVCVGVGCRCRVSLSVCARDVARARVCVCGVRVCVCVCV